MSLDDTMTSTTTTGCNCGLYVQAGVLLDCPHSKDCCDSFTDKCKGCKKNKLRSYFEPVEDETVSIPFIYWDYEQGSSWNWPNRYWTDTSPRDSFRY